MGLLYPSLRMILREYKKRPFESVLTLGRQNIYVSTSEVLKAFQKESLSPIFGDNSILFRKPIGCETAQLDERYFFDLLGVKNVMSMDVSDMEGAELIQDLNFPVPPNLYNKFDLIIDGGTSEHVFNIREVFKSISLMLKNGGRVLHFSPTNNMVQHGFYQFSPTLFYDFYGENKFINMQALLFEHSKYDPDTKWTFYEMPWEYYTVIASNNSLGTFFVAEKITDSSSDKIPTQKFYTTAFTGEIQSSAKGRILKKMKSSTPKFLKLALKNVFPFLSPKINKPWGLKKREVM
ncbi:MAG: class I SAM-dependent methyltransferase [Deltaproteobacteria bacterium]|nr:class I SAM-dependent methyltransferase [Deltaproteobacteria bacterium]